MLPRFPLLWRVPVAALFVGLGGSLAMADSLRVEDARVRVVPPVATTTAAFMALHNDGDTDRALTAVSTPAADVAELHNHVDVDGVMQMRRVDEIAVPAGGSTELAPGGLHLMLIDLAAPLHEGDEVTLTLEFDDGESLVVVAPVRSIEMVEDEGDGHAHRHHAH